MPTYEYVCRACGHRFDIVQKMSEDPLVICPECGGALRKVFAPPSISFKGSGFYATDHGKSKKGTSSTSSDKPAESQPSESAAGAKSDAGDTSGSGSGSGSETGTQKKSDPPPAKKPGPPKKEEGS